MGTYADSLRFTFRSEKNSSCLRPHTTDSVFHPCFLRAFFRLLRACFSALRVIFFRVFASRSLGCVLAFLYSLVGPWLCLQETSSRERERNGMMRYLIL